MNDKQIIEYARNMIKANLHQYAETNPALILSTVYELDNDKTNKVLLEHLIGIKELIEKAIEIIKKGNENG